MIQYEVNIDIKLGFVQPMHCHAAGHLFLSVYFAIFLVQVTNAK